MFAIDDDRFAALIAEAMDDLPPQHMSAVKNVAVVYADEPTAEQHERLKLSHGQSLFGLYEGVPLTRRQGRSGYPPDKITIFKNPILGSVSTEQELRAQVKHTVWHEIAHYFGLNHQEIRELENKPPRAS
jgi:predicted Zn-dependent protease with MMP-like domain